MTSSLDIAQFDSQIFDQLGDGAQPFRITVGDEDTEFLLDSQYDLNRL